MLAAAALALAAPAFAAPPKVVADAFLVQNGANGEILLADDARERTSIASITKLMTVLVALDHSRLNDVVTVSARAAAVGGSTAALRPGERISVRDLVKAALIESANDAADALADHVAAKSGTPFVRLMNARARSLGLMDTHFENAEGFDAPGHFSSARDVTRLARVAMREPLVRRLVRRRSATISGGRKLQTWNDLLYSFPGLIGVKTGHTSAGWSEVAAARGRGVTIYATLLGSPSRGRRNADLAALLRWGLSRYRAVTAISTERVYARARTQYGRGTVRLVAARPSVRSVHRDRPLLEHVVAPAVVALPVRRGDELGEVRVYDRGRLVARRPLVAAESIARPGAAARIRWYATRSAENVWSWIT